MVSVRLKTAMISFVAVIFASGSGAAAQTARSIDFSEKPEPMTIAEQGIHVTMQPFFDGEGDVEVATAVHAPGYQSIITKEGFATSAFYPRTVGIEKLSKGDPVPSVLLGSYTGGAHCCATLRVITPSARRLVVVDFESVDGGPETDLPKDIDGDGTVDFIRQDDRFRYQFACGAGSYSPPMILNIYKGKIVDVSDQPSYRSIWLNFANNVRVECADKKNSDRNGACIALAAAGARLGDYSTYLKEAVKNAYSGSDVRLPEYCKVKPVNYKCPDDKSIKFFSFESAANWFLRHNGYLD